MGFLSQDELDRIRTWQADSQFSLRQGVLRLGIASEADFLKAIAITTQQPLLADWLAIANQVTQPVGGDRHESGTIASTGRLAASTCQTLVSGRFDVSLADRFQLDTLQQFKFFPCGWHAPDVLAIACGDPDLSKIEVLIATVWPNTQLYPVWATDTQLQSLWLNTRLLHYLLTHHHLTLAEWQLIRSQQHFTQISLGQLLIKRGYFSASDLVQVFHQLVGLPIFSRLLNTGFLNIDTALLRYFSAADIKKYLFFPITLIDSRILIVLVQDPTYLAVETLVRESFPNVEIGKVLGTKKDIFQLVDSFYPNEFSRKVWRQLRARLTPEQRQTVEHISRQTGSTINQVAAQLGYVHPNDYIQSISQLTRIPVLSSIQSVDVNAAFLQRFDLYEMARLKFVPLAWVNDSTLQVLMHDPHNAAVDEAIYSRFPGVKIVRVLGTELDILRLVDKFTQQEWTRNSIFHSLVRSPDESAARLLSLPQLALLYCISGGLLWGLLTNIHLTLMVTVSTVLLAVVVSIGFFGVISLIGFRGRRLRVSDADTAALQDDNLPNYTILLLVDPHTDLAQQVSNIQRLDYPSSKLEVLLLLNERDETTIQQTLALKLPPNFRCIYIPAALPQTVANSRNYGLSLANGDLLTLYNPQDNPERDQLKQSVVAFRNGSSRLLCVQAGLNYIDSCDNWLSRLSAIEAFYWSRGVVLGLARSHMPIPIGGSSSHFRTDGLKALGGWDLFNMTEDVDLGIRAKQAGLHVALMASTTRSKAHHRLNDWMRERSRWVKGYLQTWLIYNRRPIQTLKRLGFKNWCAYQCWVGGTIGLCLIHPILWAVLVYGWSAQDPGLPSLLPQWLIHTTLTVVGASYGLGVVLNLWLLRQQANNRWLPLALLTPIYTMLYSVAAYIALGQLIIQPLGWLSQSQPVRPSSSLLN